MDYRVSGTERWSFQPHMCLYADTHPLAPADYYWDFNAIVRSMIVERNYTKLVVGDETRLSARME